MKQKKQLFGLFVLTTLMLVKVSAFHIYSHENFGADEIEDCTYCDLAIESQNAELLTQVYEENLTFNTLFFETQAPQIAHQNNFAGLKDGLELFLRPPPASL